MIVFLEGLVWIMMLLSKLGSRQADDVEEICENAPGENLSEKNNIL